MFEWIENTTGNINLARTMAIQALVAAHIIYLLSISYLGVQLMEKLRRPATSLDNASAIAFGIGGAVILQIIFSQVSLMNTLFKTAPLDLTQWSICLIPILPMIPLAIVVNKFFPAHTM